MRLGRWCDFRSRSDCETDARSVGFEGGGEGLMGDDFVAGIVDSARTVLPPTAWGGSGGGGGGGGGGTGGGDMQRVDKRKTECQPFRSTNQQVNLPWLRPRRLIVPLEQRPCTELPRRGCIFFYPYRRNERQ